MTIQNARRGRLERGRRLLVQIGRHWELYLLLEPAVVCMIMFNYMPL